MFLFVDEGRGLGRDGRQGDATEGMVSGKKEVPNTPYLLMSSLVIALLDFRCGRLGSLCTIGSKYIVGSGARRRAAGADRDEVLGLVYLCGANWFKL